MTADEYMTKDSCDKECRARDKRIENLYYDLYGDSNNFEQSIKYRNQTMWNDYLHRKKTTMGLWDWVYRGVIGLGITWTGSIVTWIFLNISR